MHNNFLKRSIFFFIILFSNFFSAQAQLSINCGTEIKASYTLGGTITIHFNSTLPGGTQVYLQLSEFSDMHDCDNPESNMIGNVVTLQNNPKNIITGSLNSGLDICKSYYIRISTGGDIINAIPQFSNICGPIIFSGCNDGSNMTKAVDLGNFCSKTISQVDNSQSKYSDTYSTNKPHGQTSKDVWLKFKPQSTGLFQINTCGSCIDTYIHLLDENGNEIAYNDDQNTTGWMPSSCPGSSLLSMINSRNTGYLNQPLRLIQNKTYYLVLEGYNTSQGCINAQITCCLSCTNYGDGTSYENAYDLCDISCTTDIYNTKDNSLSMFSNTYDAAINPTLMPKGQPSKDIWYTFNVTETIPLTWAISTCTSALEDTYIHLLRADKTEIVSNDDAAEYEDLELCKEKRLDSYIGWLPDHRTLTAGIYYLVVEGFGLNQGSITTRIQACWSAPQSKTENLIVQNQTKPITLKIAPNPFSNSTTLQVEGSEENTNLEIVDINGAIVYKNNGYKTGEIITLGENFLPGVYFVKANNASYSKVLKLIKVN